MNDDPKIRNPGPQNTEPPRHQARAAKKCLLLPSEDIQDEFKRAFFNSLGYGGGGRARTVEASVSVRTNLKLTSRSVSGIDPAREIVGHVGVEVEMVHDPAVVGSDHVETHEEVGIGGILLINPC